MARLQPQLDQDCIYLGKLDLCHLLVMNDSRYPWCILVPDRDGISKISQLSEGQQLAGMFQGLKTEFSGKVGRLDDN